MKQAVYKEIPVLIFSNMELDLELETQVQGFLEGDKVQEAVAVEVVRHFLLEVRTG
ncbi:MAG: hypothetical protein R3Y53_11410 [Bacillota bacterium]